MLYLLFFFQAEDGIRDRNVTGVQTCALPISIAGQLRAAFSIAANRQLSDAQTAPAETVPDWLTRARESLAKRSEERRVGKEGRDRWSRGRDIDSKERAKLLAESTGLW